MRKMWRSVYFFIFALNKLVKFDIWLLLKGKVVHKGKQNEFFEILYKEIIGIFLTHELQPQQRFLIQKSEKKSSMTVYKLPQSFIPAD